MINNCKLQSGKANTEGLQRMQHIRNIVQFIFLIVVVAGLYSSIRPVLIILLPLAFVAGNYFCGWICPFGTAQDIFGKIGSLFWKRKLKMPPKFQRYAQYSRYLLMAAVLLLGAKTFTDVVPINAYKSFMAVAGGRTVQTAALLVVGGFLAVALFFERPFCNYVCSEGIKFGVASLTRFFTIKRNPETCVNCKQCDKACPMNIQVSAGQNVRNAQCINCFKCIAACPVNNTLTYGKATLKR
jgi:polyferredoxin